jgi:hypothetical protein
MKEKIKQYLVGLFMAALALFVSTSSAHAEGVADIIAAADLSTVGTGLSGIYVTLVGFTLLGVAFALYRRAMRGR